MLGYRRRHAKAEATQEEPPYMFVLAMLPCGRQFNRILTCRHASGKRVMRGLPVAARDECCSDGIQRSKAHLPTSSRSRASVSVIQRLPLCQLQCQPMQSTVSSKTHELLEHDYAQLRSAQT